jgi:hypothetical protein
MKIPILLVLAMLATLTVAAQSPSGTPQAPSLNDPWTSKDLIQPSELAAIFENPKAKQPLIFNIGVVDDIRGAKNLGASSKNENLEKLKENLRKLPKNTFVVVYCGCCPFTKCPNVRPAFTLLKDMGFSKGRLLNLPVNLKQDWINKGYPLASGAGKS